jgi:hypothetical protein
MAIATVVEHPSSARRKNPRTGSGKVGFDAGPVDTRQPNREEVAARTVLDGIVLPQGFEKYAATMIRETKGAEYKPVMKVVTATLAVAHWEQATMHEYFLCAGHSFRSSRLRGWRQWVNFLGERMITLEQWRKHEQPERLYCEFLTWMDEPARKITENVKKEATPAVQDLFDALGMNLKLLDHSFVKAIRRNVNASVRQAPKDTTIWSIGVFTQYVREGLDPQKQPWPDLMGLSAGVLMTLLPCRPVALIRMDLTKVRTRESDGALIVPAQEKTDLGRGVTEQVFQDSPEQWLSTRFYFDILSRRAQGKGVFDALYCSDRGMKYKRSDCIGKALKRLLERMGIKGFTGYSFRHSTIQALFDAGLEERQVNAYTGHSNNAHTAVNFYYHLNKMWAAQKIRSAPTDRVQLRDEVLEIIEREKAQVLKDDDLID